MLESNFGFESEVASSIFADGDSELLPQGCPVPELQRQSRNESSRSVLVLEDDIAQLQILTQHLAAMGLRVVPAQTLTEAKVKLRDESFQLAIFDVQLPDGSGLDLCSEVDDDPELTGLPIIVLSSANLGNIVRQTRAAGGCYFIGKPYDPNVLLAMIERALDDLA